MYKLKGKLFFILVVLVLICLQEEQLQSASEVDMRNPVRSSAQDEISSLPGLNYKPSFKQYSGYLAADKTNNRFFHYWLVESQSKPSEDPLVLWLAGGPGCSSLDGMLKALGPFLFDDKREQLLKNEYAWNQKANILFLESPLGVGFSYALNGNLTTNDERTEEENYQALISFFDKFPQFKNNSLYLSGHSYAGVFVPTLAELVDKDKTMNLKGISVGNGFFNQRLLKKSALLFARYHGLIGSSTWYKFTAKCCHNDLDRTGSCDINRNFNDSTHDASEACESTITHIEKKVDDFNYDLYNIYAGCDGVSQSDNVISRRSDQHLNSMDQMLERVSPIQLAYSSNNFPCYWHNETFANYLNGQAMRDAMHIPQQLSNQFKVCWNNKYRKENYQQQYAQLPGGLTFLFRRLMQSDRKLKMLIYNGDFDYVCDFIGTEWFVDNLNDTLVVDHSPWFVGKRLAGFVKQFEHITFMTVRGAGHTVAIDKPAEALYLFEKYLLGLPPSSRSKIV